MLVDDETDLLEALRFELEKTTAAYKVIGARNGQEALDKIAEGICPDLIVLDINMPKMGGLEFYKRICESGKPKYPILVLTARANLEGLFKDLEVDGFMSKPFEIEDFLKEVGTIIEKRYPRPVIAEKVPVKKRSLPKRVLIIEDNDKAFDTIAIAFLKEGYEVNYARSGVDGVEKVLSNPTGVVLVNLGLSDIPGDIVAAKLKKMPKTMDIPIVLYTPYSDSMNEAVAEQICKNSGVEKIVKTIDPYVLLEETEKLRR